MKPTIMLVLAVLLQSPTWASEQSITKSPVRISSGDVELAGTLVMPDGDEIRPGIVLLHGSGPGPRSELLDVAAGFAHANIAAIVFDKRGTGQSEGNWISSSLFDLVDDAAAAYRSLAALPNVDSERVGFWGVSQGGWIVPLAMNQVDAAFGIVITGGGASPRQVETATYMQSLARTGPTAQEAEHASLLVETYMSYLAGDIRKADLDALFAKHKDEQWFEALGIERVVPSEANRHNWEWVATFDPTGSIAATKSPLLVLLGSDDPLVPLKISATAWRESLPTDQTDNDVRIIDGAGHGLRSGPHGGPRISNYFALQLDWLKKVQVSIRD